MKGLIKVPATSANLGAGFDVFGIALELFNFIEFNTDTKDWYFESKGEYADQIEDYSLFQKVFVEFQRFTRKKVPKLKIIQECNIPISKGLGSSAAIIAAATVISNVLTGEPLTELEMIKFATNIEGHPDNIVPAFTGGLVVSYYDGTILDYEVFKEVDFGEMNFIVPNFRLSTKEMRSVLPKQIEYESAVFNLKNSVQFLSKIAHGKYKDALKYTADRLHQEFRFNASKQLKDFIESILSKKPNFWFLSGSGPTVCADVTEFGNIPYLEKVISTKVSRVGLQIEF